jgi:hypothetical protein
MTSVLRFSHYLQVEHSKPGSRTESSTRGSTNRELSLGSKIHAHTHRIRVRKDKINKHLKYPKLARTGTCVVLHFSGENFT